jgi:hypothetical protein
MTAKPDNDKKTNNSMIMKDGLSIASGNYINLPKAGANKEDEP